MSRFVRLQRLTQMAAQWVHSAHDPTIDWTGLRSEIAAVAAELGLAPPEPIHRPISQADPSAWSQFLAMCQADIRVSGPARRINDSPVS